MIFSNEGVVHFCEGNKLEIESDFAFALRTYVQEMDEDRVSEFIPSLVMALIDPDSVLYCPDDEVKKTKWYQGEDG